MNYQNLPPSLSANPSLLNPNLSGFDSAQCKSLYVGNLDPKVNETLLYQVFSAMGPVDGCKLIKDKSGDSAGYGFVDYHDHQYAALALVNLNGRKIYNNELKVNWAYAGSQREDTTSHFHIFVGDLSPEIDDTNLFKAFSAFGSCSDARVMWDQTTGRSRGYGFVAFRKKEDAERALTDMNGEWLGSRAIRCNWANQKVNSNSPADLNDSSLSSVINSSSPTNSTVYIGNLPSDASDQFLRSVFGEYGLIEEIRIQKDRGFGFVRFQSHDSAARAIVSVNGRNIGGSRPVRCSWGKERSGNQTTSTAQVLPQAVSYPYPYMSINPYAYAPQYSQEYYPGNYPASAAAVYGYPPNYQYNGSHS